MKLLDFVNQYSDKDRSKRKKSFMPFKIRNTILIILVFLGTYTVFSQEKKQLFPYTGFSGGMMIHSGFVKGKSFEITDASNHVIYKREMKGFPFGIGGVLHFHFGNYLRIGAEGYASSLKYDKNGSHSSTGWGGFLIDGTYQLNKTLLFIGGTIGGGSVANITLQNKYGDDYQIEENVSYRKYNFVGFSPFMGLEYAFNKKVSLIFKIDYLWNLSNQQPDFTSGFRVYIGFLFYRLRE